MIHRVNEYSLFSDGLSTSLKFSNPARTVLLFSVPCVTVTYATLKIKAVLSPSNAEVIVGSQCQLVPPFEAAARHSYSGPSLNSSRRWRYRYSEVAAIPGPDDPFVAMDVDAESQGFGFSPFREAGDGFNADLFKNQTEKLRQEILSGDFEVKPTPYTPVDGTQAVQFYVTCALLFVAFWVGNYLAPNLIFKDTVFRNGNVEDDDHKDHFAERSEEVFESQQRQRQGPGPVQNVDSMTGSMKTVDGQTGKIVGFGKASEKTPKKPRRSL